METRVSSVKVGAFRDRVSCIPEEEKEETPSLPLFSPSSLELRPATSLDSLEKLSYTLTKVSPFLDLKSLGRFSCTSKKINERGTGSNALWKPFLNPRAQSQVDEGESGVARRLFQSPENRDAKYLICDQAGITYFRKLHANTRPFPELFYCFGRGVQKGTLTNELIEVANMIPHLTPEQQALLNEPGILKLMHADHLSVDEVLALAERRWVSLTNDKICGLVAARHLSVQAALALTPKKCEILSDYSVHSLIERGIFSVESALGLTPLQLEKLRHDSVSSLISMGVLSIERALELTHLQLKVLGYHKVYDLIVKGALSIDRALTLTRKEFKLLKDFISFSFYKIYKLIDDGVLTLDSALKLELTAKQWEALSQPGTSYLICTGVLTVEKALALTPEQVNILSHDAVYKFIDNGVFTLESALEFELTPAQLELLSQLGVLS